MWHNILIVGVVYSGAFGGYFVQMLLIGGVVAGGCSEFSFSEVINAIVEC